MNAAVWTSLTYLWVSVAVAIYVGRTLYRNGRIFLVDAMGGNEALADSVNQLLVVGFYLINIGYVAVALRYGEKPHSLVEGIEFFSTKLGIVLLVLGVMHFFNVYVLSRVRRRAMHAEIVEQSRRKMLATPHGTVPTFTSAKAKQANAPKHASNDLSAGENQV